MKYFFVLIFSLFSICVNAQIEKVIPPKPGQSEGLVIDYTGTLTQEQKHALNQKLILYDDSTSNQVAVVIMQTTGDFPIEDVALGILRAWGVGGKEHSNGIVLLIAKDDRKIRIEVGYGLEGAIPDITAKSIIDKDLTPNFKAGNYYRGLDAATDDIIKAAAGEYKAPQGYGKKKGRGFGFGTIIFILIMIFLFSGRGGRGGGMASGKGFSDIGTGWIIGTLLGGAGRSGSGGWSGGGGGGGFGGFGGGGGGGGGASGGW